jgi:hypothetical protein
MNKLKATLVAMCFVSVPMSVSAQVEETPDSNPPATTDRDMEQFQALDTDKSGAISSAEAEEAGMKNFSAADKNADGQLDINEYVLAARGDSGARQ